MIRAPAGVMLVALAACPSKGCAPADIDLALGLPGNADFQSIVLAISRGGEVQTAQAMRRASAEVEPLFATLSGDEGEVNAWLYRATLEEIGLAPGPLARVGGGAPLPRADAMFTAGPAGDWTESAGGPLSAFRTSVMPPNPCIAFTTATVELTSLDLGMRIQALVGLEDGSALASATGETMLRVHPDGRIATVAGLPFGLDVQEMWRAPDGELWVFTGSGDVWRGRLDTGFSRSISRTSTVVTSVDVGGPSSADAPFEIFLADEQRGIERFDGSAWTLLRGEASYTAAVSWVAPKEAYAIGGSKEVIHVFESSHTEIPITEAIEEVNDVAWVPGVGAVVASGGRAFVLANDTVSRVHIVPELNDARSFVLDLGGGAFLFGGANGRMIQIHPDLDQTTCPVETLAPDDVGQGTPIPGGFAFARRVFGDARTSVTFIVRATDR